VFDNDGTLWCEMPAHCDDKRGSRSAEREFAYDRQHMLSGQLDKGWTRHHATAGLWWT